MRILALLVTIALILLVGTSLYQALATEQDRQTYPPLGQLVDIGGFRLHLNCTGQRVNGSPTVIFEGGLGGPSLLWSLVQPQVTTFTRACSYDRAGDGWSEASPQPRTGQQIVTELNTLLRRAGEQPPYILVGHSYGGVLIRLYASQYPAEVSGLVLVSARHEDFFKRMPPAILKIDQGNYQRAKLLSIVTPFGFTRLAGQMQWIKSFETYLSPLPDSAQAMVRATLIYSPQHWQTTVAERDLIEQSFDAVRVVHLPPSLPVIVLTAANGIEAWNTPDNPLDQPTRDEWMALQRELSLITERSQWMIVDQSGHYIQLDRPDAVSKAIQDVMLRR